MTLRRRGTTMQETRPARSRGKLNVLGNADYGMRLAVKRDKQQYGVGEERRFRMCRTGPQTERRHLGAKRDCSPHRTGKYNPKSTGAQGRRSRGRQSRAPPPKNHAGQRDQAVRLENAACCGGMLYEAKPKMMAHDGEKQKARMQRREQRCHVADGMRAATEAQPAGRARAAQVKPRTGSAWTTRIHYGVGGLENESKHSAQLVVERRRTGTESGLYFRRQAQAAGAIKGCSGTGAGDGAFTLADPHGESRGPYSTTDKHANNRLQGANEGIWRSTSCVARLWYEESIKSTVHSTSEFTLATRMSELTQGAELKPKPSAPRDGGYCEGIGGIARARENTTSQQATQRDASQTRRQGDTLLDHILLYEQENEKEDGWRDECR
ncbi:hypothetical protein FB451DRAFT_1161688 [Mycena latifolia]|nr:hypothetical protein FB451DRAFT_1161688 [Mycena latifolia]